MQYTLPSQHECLEPLLSPNLAEMGPVDIIVVGYVHGPERWTRGPPPVENELQQQTFLLEEDHQLARPLYCILGLSGRFLGSCSGKNDSSTAKTERRKMRSPSMACNGLPECRLRSVSNLGESTRPAAGAFCKRAIRYIDRSSCFVR